MIIAVTLLKICIKMSHKITYWYQLKGQVSAGFEGQRHKKPHGSALKPRLLLTDSNQLD